MAFVISFPLRSLFALKAPCVIVALNLVHRKRFKHIFILFNYFLGPGPGRYALPSTCGFNKHDFTKKMLPAYSFGQRLENSSKTKLV